MGARLSQQGLKVLKVFLENPTREFAGADLMRQSGILSGTLYPLLMRFEQLALLASRWEEEEPSAMGRPRRRLYRLTGEGARASRRALDELALSSPGRLLTPEFPGGTA